MRWGPFVLPPAGAGGDADHADVVIPDGPKPCTGCYLVGIEPDLVYADGTSANLDTGVMLHHAVFFASDKVDATCGGAPGFGELGERFFAAGNERTGGVLPAGFGYQVSDGPWNGVFHVMNHSAVPRTVFVELRTRWVRDGVQPVRPVWLDMGNCGTSEYEVPAGRSSRALDVDVEPDRPGPVRRRPCPRRRRPHRHDQRHHRPAPVHLVGGVQHQAGLHGLRRHDERVRLGLVGHHPGRARGLDLEAFYDTPTAIPDAMGIMLAYVVETDDLAAGTPAPAEVTGDVPSAVLHAATERTTRTEFG